MKTLIMLALVVLSSNLLAQTAEEEALILNQELQFLEDSVSNVQAAALNQRSSEPSKETNKALNEPSLEKTYFGEDLEEDVVSTRTAGQKRRRVTE